MANTTGYSNAEVKAGVFLTFAMALFVAMLFIYGKVARVWRGHQEISVVFTSVTGLRPDAPVRYNGYEVGRVRDISILHLTDAEIKHLPHPLKASDLDNLPLTEQEYKALRALGKTAGPEFDEAVTAKLRERDRTMIKLVLEVLQEGDEKRYHSDDQVHIDTTLMGDTSVEISSGNGDILNSRERLMLGQSGDFFTNLAKSVEEVKGILSSVSDVVGKDERESVQKALRRFDTITTHIEKIVKVADERLPATWDKVDGLADSAKQNFSKIGQSIDGIQPQIVKTLSTADDAVKDLQDKIGKLADEARSAVVDVKTDVKPIFKDLQFISSNSKEDFPVMIKNAKNLAARLQDSAGKLDNVLSTGNRLLAESYPDMRRLVLAFRLGAENFEEATNLLKRRPWLIYAPAKENDAYNTAQKNARDLDLATRRFAELSTELQAIRRNLDQSPKEDLERIDFILRELSVVSESLKFAGDVSKREILPPFVRKKDGFFPIAEQFDPTLGRKKPENE